MAYRKGSERNKDVKDPQRLSTQGIGKVMRYRKIRNIKIFEGNEGDLLAVDVMIQNAKERQRKSLSYNPKGVQS